MKVKTMKNLMNLNDGFYILVKVPKEYGLCCNCHMCDMFGYDKDNKEVCKLKENGIKSRCMDDEAYWYYYRDGFMWKREELLRKAVNALKTGSGKDEVLAEIENTKILVNRDMEWKVSDEEFSQMEEK